MPFCSAFVHPCVSHGKFKSWWFLMLRVIIIQVFALLLYRFYVIFCIYLYFHIFSLSSPFQSWLASVLFLCFLDFPFWKSIWKKYRNVAPLLNLLPGVWLLSFVTVVKRKEGKARETVKRGENDGKRLLEIGRAKCKPRPSCSSRWFVFSCPSARVLNELTASVQLTRFS